MKTLVHISDLLLGRSAETRRRAIALRDWLLEAEVDHVVVTGNLTWSGRGSELATFERIFAPLASRHRLTVVPGNHDRLGDDLALAIQPGPRVGMDSGQGLSLVRFDSTDPGERTVPREQGRITDDDITQIRAALDAVPPAHLAVLLMHHQVLTLTDEHAPERLLSWLSRSYQRDISRGRHLVQELRGRCDLMLNGQGPIPSTVTPFPGDTRPLSVVNAGGSTDLGRVRVFWHEAGRLIGPPAWLSLSQGDKGDLSRLCLQFSTSQARPVSAG